jgi:hypothetical protein
VSLYITQVVWEEKDADVETGRGTHVVLYMLRMPCLQVEQVPEDPKEWEALVATVRKEAEKALNEVSHQASSLLDERNTFIDADRVTDLLYFVNLARSKLTLLTTLNSL